MRLPCNARRPRTASAKLISIQISIERISMPILRYTTRIAANRPNSAPDAPYAAVFHPDGRSTRAHTISPRPPPSPESRYSARYGQCPIMRSSTGPTHYKVIMLNRMCNSEVGWCRNIEVMKVHGSPDPWRAAACRGSRTRSAFGPEEEIPTIPPVATLPRTQQ